MNYELLDFVKLKMLNETFRLFCVWRRWMRTFEDMLSKQLHNDEFRKEYEAIRPEMDIIRSIADDRLTQNVSKNELPKCIFYRGVHL